LLTAYLGGKIAQPKNEAPKESKDVGCK